MTRSQVNMRIPDELLTAAKAKAAAEYTSLTAVVVRLLADWVASDSGKPGTHASVPTPSEPLRQQPGLPGTRLPGQT
jgi:hypothetical protein